MDVSDQTYRLEELYGHAKGKSLAIMQAIQAEGFVKPYELWAYYQILADGFYVLSAKHAVREIEPSKADRIQPHFMESLINVAKEIDELLESRLGKNNDRKQRFD